MRSYNRDCKSVRRSVKSNAGNMASLRFVHPLPMCHFFSWGPLVGSTLCPSLQKSHTNFTREHDYHVNLTRVWLSDSPRRVSRLRTFHIEDVAIFSHMIHFFLSFFFHVITSHGVQFKGTTS